MKEVKANKPVTSHCPDYLYLSMLACFHVCMCNFTYFFHCFSSEICLENGSCEPSRYLVMVRSNRGYRAEYMLFICTFTWAYMVCPCTAEALAISTCSKGTKTIKKRKKRRKKQKLFPEIGKFQSTNKHKREVMWICIVVLKTLHWWLAVFTHAMFFKQCSSPLTERDQELKTIFWTL